MDEKIFSFNQIVTFHIWCQYLFQGKSRTKFLVERQIPDFWHLDEDENLQHIHYASEVGEFNLTIKSITDWKAWTITASCGSDFLMPLFRYDVCLFLAKHLSTSKLCSAYMVSQQFLQAPDLSATCLLYNLDLSLIDLKSFHFWFFSVNHLEYMIGRLISPCKYLAGGDRLWPEIGF